MVEVEGFDPGSPGVVEVVVPVVEKFVDAVLGGVKGPTE